MTARHVPCERCDMDTREWCPSWDHLRVSPLITLRLADGLRSVGTGPGRIVPRWVLELLADEFFADSPMFDRQQFLQRCGCVD